MTDEKKTALREVLKKELVWKELERSTPLEMDSLDVLSICVAIEKECGVELAYGDVKGLATYGDLEDLVAEKSP